MPESTHYGSEWAADRSASPKKVCRNDSHHLVLIFQGTFSWIYISGKKLILSLILVLEILKSLTKRYSFISLPDDFHSRERKYVDVSSEMHLIHFGVWTVLSVWLDKCEEEMFLLNYTIVKVSHHHHLVLKRFSPIYFLAKIGGLRHFCLVIWSPCSTYPSE